MDASLLAQPENVSAHSHPIDALLALSHRFDLTLTVLMLGGSTLITAASFAYFDFETVPPFVIEKLPVRFEALEILIQHRQIGGAGHGRGDQLRQRGPEPAVVTRLGKARDERAFNALVARFQDRVYNLIRRLLGNPEEARDVTQEVFVSVFEKVDSEMNVGGGGQ